MKLLYKGVIISDIDNHNHEGRYVPSETKDAPFSPTEEKIKEKIDQTEGNIDNPSPLSQKKEEPKKKYSVGATIISIVSTLILIAFVTVLIVIASSDDENLDRAVPYLFTSMWILIAVYSLGVIIYRFVKNSKEGKVEVQQ